MNKSALPKAALLLVDLQNDFCPGGALAVAEGDAAVAVANRLIAQSAQAGELIVATRDEHPAGHGSFASAHPGTAAGECIELGGIPQVLWRDHCVKGTPGADYHPDLAREHITREFTKGTDPAVDSYSGFYDNDHASSTGLAAYLRAQGVGQLIICGLATDYCVKATALDAVSEGFAVTLVTDGCRAVNLNPGDGEVALAELKAAGVKLV